MKERDTVDTLAVMLAATACIVIVVASVGVVILVVAQRGSEVPHAASQIGKVVSGILFVTLGMVAGRSSRRRRDDE